MSTIVEQAVPAGTWQVDPVHSSVGFAVKHMGVGTFKGSFDTFTATLADGTVTIPNRSLINQRADRASVATAIETSDEARMRLVTFSARSTISIRLLSDCASIVIAPEPEPVSSFR